MKDLVRISFKKDNATWYAAHGNTVSESATPYYLQQCLENWDKVGIEHNRNMRYGSLFATASLESYQFVNEAALILRYVYYTSGLAAKVVFSVEVLDTTSQEYQPMISSHIDWTSFKDERLRVNVTMLEDSVVTLVKNRENIEYNIPVTGSKVKTVRVKPQHAPGSIRFTSQWPPQNAAPGTLNETITGPSQVYMIYVDKSSIAVDAAPDYVAVVPSPPDNNIGKYTEGQIYTSGIYESNYLFKSTVPLSNVQITGTFHFGVTNAGNLTLTTTGATNIALPLTGTLATIAGTETLTNKTLTAPVISSFVNTGTMTVPSISGTLVQYVEGNVASSAAPAPQGDARENYLDITALATTASFSAPSGTAVNHNTLLVRIKDNGAARTLSWNAIYRAGSDFALPTTTVAGKTMYIMFVYNSADSKWDCTGLTQGF